MILQDGEIRTCDVGVYAAPPAGEEPYRPASAFALLAEVVSDRSRRQDRTIKPVLYAAAGVPEYWRVEDEGQAVVHRHHLRIDAGPPHYDVTDVVPLVDLERATPG